MTQQDAIDAFMAILDGLQGVGQIAPQGTDFFPVETQPFVSAQMSAYTGNPIGFGADSVIEYTGTFQMTVKSPQLLGMGFAGELAAQIAAAFPRALAVVTATGKTLSVMNTSEAPVSTEAPWIIRPVLVQWFGTDP